MFDYFVDKYKEACVIRQMTKTDWIQIILLSISVVILLVASFLANGVILIIGIGAMIAASAWIIVRSNKERKKFGYAQESFNKRIINVETALKECKLNDEKSIDWLIEEMLSSLDNAVETLKKAKELLAVYRQSVLKELFDQLKGERMTLGDIIVSKPRNGFSPKGVTYDTSYKNLTLTATTGGIFKENCFKYIDIDTDEDSYLWVKHNDILIQRANTVEYVGTSAMYTGEDNRYVYPDLMMKFHVKEEFDPIFVLYQIKFAHARGYYRKHATGTAGNMPKINQSTVMSTPVIMTSKDVQEKIVEKLDAQFSVYDSIKKQ